MKPQFIKTEAGEELVVLTRTDYEDLVVLAEMGEDAGTARIVERSEAAIAAGDEVLIPGEVVHSISHGENPIKVFREWRGLTRAALARRNKLTEGYVTQLEAGSASGSPRTMKAIAKTLKVPVDLLLPD